MNISKAFFPFLKLYPAIFMLDSIFIFTIIRDATIAGQI